MLEMMLAVALLLIVSGVVFSQIANVVNRYSAEESRMTAVDDTREFVDQIVRDLHQTNFPHLRMFTPTFTGSQPYSNNSIAAGLVVAGPTQLQFEADLDGKGNGAGAGQVQVVVYQLTKNGALVTDLTQCPCVLQRGQELKQANTAPESQPAPTFTSEVDNVINPASEPPFRFFDQFGNEVTAIPNFKSTDLNPTISKIYTIKISVTVQGPSVDPLTKVKPEVTYATTAQMNN